MESKSKKMHYTDLKDMLKQTGEAYADRPAYMFKTEEKGKFKTNAYSENTDITDKLEVKEIEYYEYEAKEN